MTTYSPKEFYRLCYERGMIHNEFDMSDIPQEIIDYCDKELEKLGLEKHTIIISSTPNHYKGYFQGPELILDWKDESTKYWKKYWTFDHDMQT